MKFEKNGKLCRSLNKKPYNIYFLFAIRLLGAAFQKKTIKREWKLLGNILCR